jgi:hypothetical protein
MTFSDVRYLSACQAQYSFYIYKLMTFSDVRYLSACQAQYSFYVFVWN